MHQLHHLVSALLAAPELSLPASKPWLCLLLRTPSGQELLQGLPSAASLVVALPEAEYMSCWHLPFLCSQDGFSCQRHTTTPATEALGNMGTQESNQTQRLQMLTFSGL